MITTVQTLRGLVSFIKSEKRYFAAQKTDMCHLIFKTPAVQKEPSLRFTEILFSKQHKLNLPVLSQVYWDCSRRNQDKTECYYTHTTCNNLPTIPTHRTTEGHSKSAACSLSSSIDWGTLHRFYGTQANTVPRATKANRNVEKAGYGRLVQEWRVFITAKKTGQETLKNRIFSYSCHRWPLLCHMTQPSSGLQ